MKERIEKLHKELDNIGALYLIYQIRNNVERIKKLISDIQWFVLWFLEKNRINIEECFYKDLCENLVYILQDILEAMQQEDMVLLHDSVVYGLMEYTKLFVDTEQEDIINDSL